MKIQKKNRGGGMGRGGVGGRGRVWGGQSGCDRRIEVFRKIKLGGGRGVGGGGFIWGGGGGRRVDVTEKMKFFVKIHLFFLEGGGGSGLM